MKLVRVLLPTGAKSTTHACRDAAVDLARRFGAGLEVLHICPAPWQRVPYATELSPYYTEDLIEVGREMVVAEQGEARAWFEACAQSCPDVDARFVAAEGVFAPMMAARARVADMSVVPSSGDRDDAFWQGVREGALIQSGRPMIVVPDGATIPFGETVVVAWKDTVESVRALIGGQPLLAAAKLGSLVTVAERGRDTPSLDAVADYLTRAGVAVETSKIEASADVAAALLEEAAKYPGALLVMGGYGHWRWREWAFGGVTEHVLRHTKLPVLMAH